MSLTRRNFLLSSAAPLVAQGIPVKDRKNFVVADTFYTTRLLNQPNDIVNLSFGYDYEGFAARVSMLYTDNIFKRPDFWLQNRVNSARHTRWDLALRQNLPWFGIQQA